MNEMKKILRGTVLSAGSALLAVALQGMPVMPAAASKTRVHRVACILCATFAGFGSAES